MCVEISVVGGACISTNPVIDCRCYCELICSGNNNGKEMNNWRLGRHVSREG